MYMYMFVYNTGPSPSHATKTLLFMNQSRNKISQNIEKKKQRLGSSQTCTVRIKDRAFPGMH